MQSDLAKLCARKGIKAVSVYGANKAPHSDPEWQCHPYRVTLHNGRRRLSVDFFQGSAHTEEPSAADVLSCLISDASAGEQSFEDFCSDFGYNVDSRKAETTWKACAKIAPRLRRFLGSDFAAFQRAEH